MLNNLLYGFDNAIFWMRMDNCQLNNDNSNYLRHFYEDSVKIRMHGHPLKLPLNKGLYLDGCGVDIN